MKDFLSRLPARVHNLRMEFIGAIENGDIDRAQAVMARAANGDIDNTTIDRALNTAIADGNLKSLQFLLPHAKAAPQDTLDALLISAAGALDLHAIRFLLKAGADPAFHDAAAVKRALEFLQPGYTAERDRDVASCLHALLDAGADKSGALSQVVLLTAMRRKITPLVHYMLREGTTLEPRWSGTGYNPLVIAASFGFSNLVEKIHKTAPPAAPYYHAAIHAAAERGNENLVRQLIGYGYDPKTTQGIDIPFAAAVGGQVDFLKILHAEGLSTDLTDATLMEAVISHDDARMLDYMLENGASLVTAHEIHIRTARLNNGARPYLAVQRLLEKWDARGDTVSCDGFFARSLDDLRAKDGVLKLAQAARFDEVMACHNIKHGVLTQDDLCKADKNGNRVIDILGAHGALPKLFAPEKWRGKKTEMMALLSLVPPVYLNQIDHMNLKAEHLHDLLVQKARNKRPPRL